ncbi:MAG: hypothetical protein HY859_00405 [Caulobacterales bacterium]|nr:hypothetical protein [Caulobacterales bacterium]
MGEAPAASAPADDLAVAVAVRLAGEFFVRGVEIVARAHGGDLLRGIIFTAIAVANGEASPTAGGGGGERRPVSVMSIANSIGVPYETTRRYVNMLVAENLCVRDGRRGVYIPEHALLTPEMTVAYRESFASFNRLATAMKRSSGQPPA